MEYILRQSYLNEIQKFINKPVTKILIGMRRVGKSTILKMISEVLLKDIPSKNKIFLNFESLELLGIRNAENFAKYLQPFLKQNNDKKYFFFDEIQVVHHWEEVINGLQADYDCDIYITGSNSTMLSSDLATVLAGRYVQFEIYPFTSPLSNF